MKTNLNKLPKGKVELTIELEAEELTPFLNRASQRLSQKNKIAGFRPGKTPYHIVEKQLGAMSIYEEALEEILNDSYAKILKESNIFPAEKPKIEVLKFAPKNPLVYKVTFAAFPKIKLGNYKNIKVRKREIKITEKQIEKILKDLQKMRAKETAVERAVQKNDKIMADLEMFIDKVLLENGKNKNAQIIIGDSLFLPDFGENLIGLKKNETKEFSFKYPPDHYDKKLAGKLIEFKAKINEVYQIDYPEINDEFAKSLGKFENLEILKKKLEENLNKEEEIKEDQRIETEILGKLADISEFEEIPDVLIDSEAERMIFELEGAVKNQGMDLNHYFEHLKKTRDGLKKELSGRAEKRVKIVLILEELARQKNFEISEQEIEGMKQGLLAVYGHNPEITRNIETGEYKDYLFSVMRHKKAIEFLKLEIIR